MNKNVIAKLSRLSYMWRLLITAPQFTGVFLVHQEFTRFSNGGEVLSQSNIGHDFTDTIHLGIDSNCRSNINDKQYPRLHYK